mmetsp:Transcript_40528/g.100072  ORF Transcript_40528/g.100072 Transcript_40528/m.100072 type:complete len:264 (-) Transcript_40528:549-1340(-)
MPHSAYTPIRGRPSTSHAWNSQFGLGECVTSTASEPARDTSSACRTVSPRRRKQSSDGHCSEEPAKVSAKSSDSAKISPRASSTSAPARIGSPATRWPSAWFTRWKRCPSRRRLEHAASWHLRGLHSTCFAARLLQSEATKSDAGWCMVLAGLSGGSTRFLGRGWYFPMHARSLAGCPRLRRWALSGATFSSSPPLAKTSIDCSEPPGCAPPRWSAAYRQHSAAESRGRIGRGWPVLPLAWLDALGMMVPSCRERAAASWTLS